MCVDRGSMGQNIVSALRNLNKRYADIVKGIDFGGTSRMKQANPKRAGPWNRRAEMYGDFKTWLTEGGSIPDDDDLASDISGPKQKWRANNDWLLESKTEMKARGFAHPIFPMPVFSPSRLESGSIAGRHPKNPRDLVLALTKMTKWASGRRLTEPAVTRINGIIRAIPHGWVREHGQWPAFVTT
jgi:hypothetical protein